MSAFGGIVQPEEWPDEDEVSFAMEYAREQAFAREVEETEIAMRAHVALLAALPGLSEATWSTEPGGSRR